MELTEAISGRISIRAFRPDPVAEADLTEILRIATRSPSGVNSQPWEFYVVMDEGLRQLKRANLEAYRRGELPHPDVPVGAVSGIAPALKDIYKERQVALAKQIFQLMGIAKGDREGQERWNESMVQFYDAPAVIIMVVDEVLGGAWPILDIGLITQDIVLLAQEYGLGTCIMRAIVDYPEAVRKVVDIPDSKRLILGVSVGYPDWDHPINQLRTEREPIENILTVVR
jgi:nitroreductase